MKAEDTDVNIRAIAGIVIVFVVLVAVIFAGTWGFYEYVRACDQVRDVRRTLVPPAAPVPPEPRLQVSPQDEYQVYTRDQQRILTSYEWISRDEGRVRIPIRRAMDLLSERA